MITKQKRPKFLNLLKIHLPVTGVNSIAHRISGALLFLAIPAVIYLFGLSIKSEQGFTYLMTLMDSMPFKLAILVLAWAIGHHLLAGIRFLLTDLDIATSLKAARMTAWIVNISGIVIFLILSACVLL